MSESTARGVEHDPAQWSFGTERVRAGRAPHGATAAPASPIHPPTQDESVPHSRMVNIGKMRSLVIHPASTTHAQLTPETRLAAGPARRAVGIEDIPVDLRTVFAAATT